LRRAHLPSPRSDNDGGHAALCPPTRFHFQTANASVRSHLSPCGRGRIASSDAIRVRGYALSIGLPPSPQPSPTRGEGAHRRLRKFSIPFSNSHDNSIVEPSLRANGSRECAPDDRLHEAIHLAARRKNGLLRFARNDVTLIPDTTLRPRGAMRPSCAFISRPLEGVRECRVPAAPIAPRAKLVVHTSVATTGPPGSPGIPARNGFNDLFRALPGDRALLPPSSADMVLSAPGRADTPSANLTPASGRQDHTTSPSAAIVSRQHTL